MDKIKVKRIREIEKNVRIKRQIKREEKKNIRGN